MTADLLDRAPWSCAATDPALAVGPAEVNGAASKWWAATVPGTAASALRQNGRWDIADGRDFDASDWWFRCRFEGDPGRPAPNGRGWLLQLGGLATIADVWLNGDHVLHSENMFSSHELCVDVLAQNELVIRCGALSPLLVGRRPRPRWKSALVGQQGLRWYRTTLLGRMPGWAGVAAPVGPWRPIRLTAAPPLRAVERRLVASCDGGAGRVDVALRLRGAAATLGPATLHVGGTEGPLHVVAEGDDLEVRGSVLVADVHRWWPHTHGSQPLYPVALALAGHIVHLGRVGFRTLEVDRTDDGFTLLVNDVQVFCRGACWMPTDAVALSAPAERQRHSLELVRDAHANMVRLPGMTVYEDDAFWDLCDQLGILVWQDCMFANLDPPDDEAFVAGVEEELNQVLTGLQGRPSLAVICGGSEVQQQAAMLGLPAERYRLPLFETTIPTLAARLLPGVPYVPNSPSGGELPFTVDAGVAHYYGVGAYLRPPSDARLAGVRFAAECLAFSVPPERQTVDECFGGAAASGHRPDWKWAVPRDAGASWDFADVRDFYVRLLFEVDPGRVRSTDPERDLDLGRAAMAELVAQVMREWRRPGSSCAGGLVLSWQDLWPGAGWGVLDALGRPKATWYALRRAWRPVALMVADEGLNGLRLHVVNEGASEFSGTVRVELYADGERPAGDARAAVRVPARRGVVLSADGLFGAFRDLGHVFRFGPPAQDVVVATLLDAGGGAVSEHIHLPLGLDRAVEPDVGLSARADLAPDGSWRALITTRRFAQSVAVDVPGFRPADSWFHLAPGASRHVELEPDGSRSHPVGEVRALNSRALARLEPTG